VIGGALDIRKREESMRRRGGEEVFGLGFLVERKAWLI
jgi:hypothetical protein